MCIHTYINKYIYITCHCKEYIYVQQRRLYIICPSFMSPCSSGCSCGPQLIRLYTLCTLPSYNSVNSYFITLPLIQIGVVIYLYPLHTALQHYSFTLTIKSETLITVCLCNCTCLFSRSFNFSSHVLSRMDFK